MSGTDVGRFLDISADIARFGSTPDLSDFPEHREAVVGLLGIIVRPFLQVARFDHVPVAEHHDLLGKTEQRRFPMRLPGEKGG
ncbi:MAG TPA: hypothetical protein VEC06_00120 [Paucimonas sp.]|nr:hypothetical protein [Paucimonas sp.]